jgi:hypothetical protein
VGAALGAGEISVGVGLDSASVATDGTVGSAGAAVGGSGVSAAATTTSVAVAGGGVTVGSTDPHPAIRSEPSKISANILGRMDILPPFTLRKKPPVPSLYRKDLLEAFAIWTILYWPGG